MTELSDDYLHKISKTSKQASIITALGAIMIAAAVGYSIYQLKVLDDILKEKNKDVIVLENKKEQLNAQLTKTQQEVLALKKEIKLVQLSNKSFEEGIQYYYKQQYSKAIEAYSKSLKANVTSAALGLRGQAKFKLQNYQSAKEDLNQAIVLNVENQQAYYSLSLVHWQLGEQELAVDTLEQLLLINPDRYPSLKFEGNFKPFQNYSKFKALLQKEQNKILFVQKSLKALGFYDSVIDAVPGTETRKAIINYQKKYNLSESGTWTIELIESLKATMN